MLAKDIVYQCKDWHTILKGCTSTITSISISQIITKSYHGTT